MYTQGKFGFCSENAYSCVFMYIRVPFVYSSENSFKKQIKKQMQIYTLSIFGIILYFDIFLTLRSGNEISDLRV